ncbi:MAG: DUF1501 domain-containing protein [Aquabacterium sp.]
MMNRRRFLRQGSVLSGAVAATPWALNLATLGSASAQTASTDYRALVCVFLNGGNDGHNTVIPTDAVSWRCYTATRDPAVRAKLAGVALDPNSPNISLALAQSSLLSITHANKAALNTGRTFALNPQLRQIQQLYASGKAAIVANVGPLVQPTTKVDLNDPSFILPKKLYSHNDQQTTWQSFGPEGATGGWGGKFMDSLQSRNVNKTFSCVGVNTSNVWLAGRTVTPYQLGTSGVFMMGGDTGSIMGSASLYQAVRAVSVLKNPSDPFAQDYARVSQRALDAEAALRQALPARTVAPWGTAGSTALTSDPLLQYTSPATGKAAYNELAGQLQLVARMISARNHAAISAKRQVFMVTLNGFDTHSDQMSAHPELMAKLDHAIGYFMNVLNHMPDGTDMRSQVTTFTASEFGRTLVNNGDGTDHGWGNHHFVVGGGVKGTDIYGRYPQFMAFDGNGEFFSDQLLRGGVLLPELAVDQMVYTLGKWMGVADADLVGTTAGAGICPNIGNFAATSRDIGFMSA